MSAVGPNTPRAVRGDLLTTCTAALTIGSADIPASAVFNAGTITRIYCNAAGTLSIKRSDDAGFVAYTVSAGQYIDGNIIAIAGTAGSSPASTAIPIVCEI
jgi:hypothetical protein